MSVVQPLTVSSPDADANLDKLALRIVELRLAEPVQFLIEAHLPLLNLGRHLGLLFQPLLAPVFGNQRFESLLSVFEDSSKAQGLLERLERYSTTKAGKETEE